MVVLGTTGNSLGTVCFGSQVAVVGDLWDNLTITTSNGSWCDEAAIRVGNLTGGTGGGWDYTFFGAANSGPCGTASFPLEDYNLPGGSDVFNTDASGCIHYQIYDVVNDAGNALDFTFNSGSITFYGCPLGQVLPVEIKSIYAIDSDLGNLIIWTTASESYNDVQIVERSVDGVKDWVEIDQVRGTNSNKETTYEVIDEKPLTTSYYRIRSLDYDGKEQFSKIVMVQRSGKDNGKELSIHPNPTRNNTIIDLDVTTDDQVDILISDMAGKLFSTHTYAITKGANSLQIGLDEIPSGVYLLTIQGKSIYHQNKIVKE